MDMVKRYTKMGIYMKENLKIINLMEKENSHGKKMEKKKKNMMGNGKMVKDMEKVP